MDFKKSDPYISSQMKALEKEFIIYLDGENSLSLSEFINEQIERINDEDIIGVGNKIEVIVFKKLKIKVKKCKNCGKYFALKGDYVTDYCDRITENGKYTCKKIGAIKARKEKLSANLILQEYQKAYKRFYARVSNGKMSRNEFMVWTEEAMQKRDKAMLNYENSKDEQIILNFKKYLGNK